MEKLVRLAQKALDFRAEQEKRLGHDGAGCKHSTALKLGGWVGGGDKTQPGRQGSWG